MEGTALDIAPRAVLQTLADLAWPMGSSQLQGPQPRQQHGQQQRQQHQQQQQRRLQRRRRRRRRQQHQRPRERSVGMVLSQEEEGNLCIAASRFTVNQATFIQLQDIRAARTTACHECAESAVTLAATELPAPDPSPEALELVQALPTRIKALFGSACTGKTTGKRPCRHASKLCLEARAPVKQLERGPADTHQSSVWKRVHW